MTLAKDTILERRYRIDHLLGQGGMGAIYRGFDLRLKRPIAIKENFLQSPENIAQFEQEARLLADLSHPNLPRVIDYFGFEEKQYLVMDFIEGQDLWEIIQQLARPLSEAEALSYIQQVCEAVNYLHQRKPPIIHRDIKPQNIKITPEGKAVLVDFGIAKLGEPETHTSDGARGVTPGFSPPEQYSGKGTGLVSDIYALGATLYALLTKRNPPDSVSLLIDRSLYQPPEKLNPGLSPRLSQAITHAMQPQPKDRPTSVLAWLEELGLSPHISTVLIRPDVPIKRNNPQADIATIRVEPLAENGATVSVDLVRGQNVSLSRNTPNLTRIAIGLGWDAQPSTGRAFDLDASAFLLNDSGKAISDDHFVFYNHLTSPDGAVQHMGDNLTGAGEGDDEIINVDLLRVSPEVKRIAFTVTIYEAEGRGQNFGMVSQAFIRVVNRDDGQELARYDLGKDCRAETSMIFGEVYRYNSEWKFKAIGQGFAGSMESMVKHFGIAVQ